MSFFNSIPIRVALALIGGILYGLLTNALVLVLDLPIPTAMVAAIFVSLLYLGSRLLILFSGINTPYYFKEHRDSSYENTPFHRTAQWVGKFYHYHDIFLFLFLVAISILFLVSLVMLWLGNESVFNWFIDARNLLLDVIYTVGID